MMITAGNKMFTMILAAVEQEMFQPWSLVTNHYVGFSLK